MTITALSKSLKPLLACTCGARFSLDGWLNMGLFHIQPSIQTFCAAPPRASPTRKDEDTEEHLAWTLKPPAPGLRY